MLKVIALITRKPGLSRTDFINHYETGHAPLARKCFPQIVQYRRNFVDMQGAIMAPGIPDPDFDSVTEIWYRDRAAYDEMLSTHFSTDIQRTIEEDEKKFLDQSMTRFFVVDERGAKHANADLRPTHGAGSNGMFKVIALLSAKTDISKTAFIDYYESRHAKLIWSLFPWIIEYRRNFVDLTGAIIGSAASPPDFDVVTELWFRDRADYDRMLATHADPAVGGAVAADEENCFDRSKTRFFIVEEAESDAPVH
jgi:hypothetical protein